MIGGLVGDASSAPNGPVLIVRGPDCLDGTPLVDIKAEFAAL